MQVSHPYQSTAKMIYLVREINQSGDEGEHKHSLNKRCVRNRIYCIVVKKLADRGDGWNGVASFIAPVVHMNLST